MIVLYMEVIMVLYNGKWSWSRGFSVEMAIVSGGCKWKVLPNGLRELTKRRMNKGDHLILIFSVIFSYRSVISSPIILDPCKYE